MSPSVFIDGRAGTIGLRIHDLLEPRRDLSILHLDEQHRKDPQARREMLNTCDVAILCLPDEASRESVSMVTNPRVRIIDGSTAFRVSPNWVYGIPELDRERRSAIRAASRVTNPGCWATCTCLLTRPLVSTRLLPEDFHFTIHGVSGYTGGGKTMIARWESPELGLPGLPFPAPYAFDRVHKHMPEIMCHGLLRSEPSFSPSVGAFARGMRVEIPLHAGALPAGVTARSIRDVYGLAYAHEPFVRLGWTLGRHETPELRFDPRQCNDTNDVLIHVMEHPSGHVVLMAILDNLGKGASGAAVQTLNLMLGLDEDRGLVPDRP